MQLRRLIGGSPLAERWQELGGRTAVVVAAEQLLRERGQELCGETRRPDAVSVETRSLALLGSIRFGPHVRQIVLKPTRTNIGIRDSRTLADTLGALAASNPLIASALPSVLGYDEPTQMLIMSHEPGDPLLSQLRTALRFTGRHGDRNDRHFREAANVLGAIHGARANQLLPGAKRRSIQSFVGSFEALAPQLSLAFTRAGFTRPAQLLERFGGDFFAREGNGVLLIDARPKNMLVRPDGSLCFVDLDCAPASPAMGIAAFLAGLDRCGSRYPWPRSQARLRSWKRAFVQAYLTPARRTVTEELTFFYPWTVLQMWEQHVTDQPMYGPYLRRYYGAQLFQFLRQLQSMSADDLARHPAHLFKGPRDEARPAAVAAKPRQALLL